MNKLKAIAEVLGHDPWAIGSRSPQAVAQEWAEAGFDALEVADWLDVARCFDPTAASMLRDAGISPWEAAQQNRYDTIGYEVANGDLSIERVLRKLGR